MSTDLERLVVRLEAQMKSYEREWQKARGVTDSHSRAIERRVEQTAKRIQASMGRINGLLAGTAGGVVAGVGAGLVGILGGQKFITETIAAEKAVMQLNAVLASTGGVSGFTAAELTDMAGGLQKVTTFGDDAIIAGQALLLTFTKIGKDAFPKALEAAMNVSTAMGTDLKSAIIQVGKAYNDPIKGVTALGRAGIQFTQTQRDQIKTMQEAGNIAGAQTIVQKELETQFGNSARAARDTLGGALASLNNAFGDLFEVKDTEGMRSEIESIIRLLQEDSTASAVQALGVALFSTFSAGIRGARDFYLEVSGMINDIRSGNFAGASPVFAGARPARKMPSTMEGFVDQPDVIEPARTESDVIKEMDDRLRRYGIDPGSPLEDQKHEGPKFQPKRRYGGDDGDTATGGGTTKKDSVDREEDRIQKRIELLQAETSTLGMTTEARERARAEAELWSAVEKAGIPVTDELLIKISYLADAWGEAAAQAETAKNKFKEIENAAKEFSSSVGEAFKGLVLEGQKFNEVLSQMAKRLASKGIDKAFDMLFFGNSGRLTSGEGLFGSIFSSFGGARAGGGPVEAGKSYLVGERGPELVRLGQSGMVTPNSALRSGGGGGPSIALNISNDFRGADSGSEARITAQVEGLRRSIPGMVVSSVRDARRRSVAGF